MLEFNGKRPILKNLTIEPIGLSAEQNQELDKIMTSKKGTLYKRYTVRKTMISNTGSREDFVSTAGVPDSRTKVPRFKSNISSEIL